MSSKVVKLFFFLAISTAITHCSEHKSFKMVNIHTDKEDLGVISESNSIKEYLPNSTVDLLYLSGNIPVLYKDSVTDIERVKKLAFYRNGLTEIHPGAFKNFKGVETLVIAANNLTTIRPNTFKDLTIKQLEIIDNTKLTTMDDGALDNDHIETLVLNGNQLTHLKKDSFRKLPALKSLLIKSNKLIQIQEEVFEGLSIENLDLTANQLTTIPQNFLHKLGKLKKIYFPANKLTTISSGIFSSHPTLQEIDISHNQISHIDSDAFDNIPQLTSVILAFNKLPKIDSQWFHNSPKIREFNLIFNSIEKIPDQAFKNFDNDEPKILRFDNNKIKDVSEGAFKGLKNIHELTFELNELEKWDAKYLADVDKVEKLDLNSNQIRCPEGDFDQVFKPHYVYLGGNPLDSKCLEKINEWKNRTSAKGHFVCTGLLCPQQT